MNRQYGKYLVAEVDLADIRNRNESRVVEAMCSVLEEYGNPALDMETIQDAYAYALNQLPARYAQNGTIILRDPVRPHEIRAVVENALQRVMNNPRT